MEKIYKKISAALILYDERQNFLLQLRDDIPSIVYPGHWGLFGGEVEPGEQVIDTFYREIEEELDYQPGEIYVYSTFELEAGQQLVHLGIAKLTVPLTALHQTEGQDMGLFSKTEIESGWLLSGKHGKKFKVAPPIMHCYTRLFLDSNLAKILK